MNEYEIVRDGAVFTFLLSEEDARRLGARPVEAKRGPAPADKARTPADKARTPADKGRTPADKGRRRGPAA